ncbi:MULTISPECIES: hypothetical protein [unclassified Streptomyces]
MAQFALKGWCGTSVEAKAKRAGVTQPHLPRPFPALPDPSRPRRRSSPPL